MPIDTEEEYEIEKINLSTLHNHIVKIKKPMLYFKSLNLISNDIFETKIEKKYFSNQQLLANTAQDYCNKANYVGARLREDLHIISRSARYDDDNITAQILNGMIEFINSPENNNPILRFMDMDTNEIYKSLYRGDITEFEFLPNYNKIYEMYETQLYTRYTNTINNLTGKITEYTEMIRLRQEAIELNEDYKIGINNIPPISIIIFDTESPLYKNRLSTFQKNLTFRIIKVCNKIVKMYNVCDSCPTQKVKGLLEDYADIYAYRVYKCHLGVVSSEIIKTEDCCVYKKINGKIELCHSNESDNIYFKSTYSTY